MSDTTLMQRLRHMAGDCNALAIFREAADALEQQARELNDAINEFTAANAEIERQAAQIAEKDAEIARVTAELEALKGDLDPLFKDLADYGEEIEALRADAERYRWLRMRLKVREQRSMSGRYKDSIYIRVAQSFFDTPTRGDDGYLDKAIFAKECCEFDAAIDAALRQEQPT